MENDVTKGDPFTSFNVDDSPVPHGRDDAPDLIAAVWNREVIDVEGGVQKIGK